MNATTVPFLFLIALLSACSPQPDDGTKSQTKEIVFPNDPEYLKWQLSRYGLEELKGDRSIRFLWLRSFHPAIVFEIKYKSERKIEFSAKQWKFNTWISYESKTLKIDDSPLVTTDEMDLFGFFEMPHFNEEDFRIADGASWIFEAKTKDKHHWVWKQSPKEETLIGRWGKTIIEESIDSPAVPIY